jgi:hypothetical protein
MKERLITTGKVCGGVAGALGVCLTFPVLIWVAVGVHVRHLIVERSFRARLSSSALICRLDSDCPQGYRCIDGRCIPVLQTS